MRGAVGGLAGCDGGEALVGEGSGERTVQEVVRAVAQAERMPVAACRIPDIDAIAAGHVVGVQDVTAGILRVGDDGHCCCCWPRRTC